MDSKAQPPANSPPPKPWERAGGSSGPVPFKPPSAGTTSDVVEASGTAKPGEIVSTSDINTAVNRNMLARPVPTRPWEQNYGNTSYGGYGSTMNTGYGSGLYGSSYGGVGGMYGNSMARGSYGGHFGSGMYGGGGMYNSGLGGPMSGYGMGMGGPYGDQDPNNPYGQPSSPPGFWISVLRVLFDRSGVLYGELARFVMRILGISTKAKKVKPVGPGGHPLPGVPNQNYIEAPKAAPTGSWDNVWENDASK